MIELYNLNLLANVASQQDPLPLLPITLVNYSEVDETIANEALDRINRSVHWQKTCIPLFQRSFRTVTFAKKGEELVGYIACMAYKKGNPFFDAQKLHSDPHHYVAYLAVEEEYQREGVAQKLMLNAINDAQARGAKKLVLEYEGDNPKSSNFYGKIGEVVQLDTKDKPKGNYLSGRPKVKKTFYLNNLT